MADATNTQATPTAPATPADAPTDGGNEGKGGKDAVLRDLATERDKRQALEAQVQLLTASQQSQKDALAKAFGLTPDETSDVSRLAEQVTSLKQDFNDTKHTNTVLTVANEHGISDKDDLALLSEVKDEAMMRGLAARLAKAAGESNSPHTPKPDLTQGGRSGAAPATSPRDAFAAFMKGSGS